VLWLEDCGLRGWYICTSVAAVFLDLIESLLFDLVNSLSFHIYLMKLWTPRQVWPDVKTLLAECLVGKGCVAMRFPCIAQKVADDRGIRAIKA